MKRSIGAVLAALALVAAACGDDGAESTATTAASTVLLPSTTLAATTLAATTTVAPTTVAPTTQPVTTTTQEVTPVGVELVDYPLFETDVIAPDQALLDELAAGYIASLDGADPEMERFLFGDVPVLVFDRMLAGEVGDERAELLWLMHLSGYYGGRWLRGEIATAQPDALVVGFSSPATAESFGATMARAQLSLDVVDSDDDAAAVDHARESLFDEPPEEEGGDPIRGLTDNFGYNVGYASEILDTPPEGLIAPDQYRIECSGLFGCSYATPRLAALPELADVQAAINDGVAPYETLSAELLPIQEAAEPRGRAVWSSGLSVQGFPQEEYEQLLDVSSSYLEMVQATGLTMAQAAAAEDAAQARRGALANAVMIVWLDAYFAGLTDGDGEIEVPSFT